MRCFYFLLFICYSFGIYSQEKYITRNGKVQFNASTPLEDIKPTNNYVSCILDTENGNIVFQLKMLSFQFEKALMEEHFNEKYVESEKFPTSTFIGRILNWSSIDRNINEHNIVAQGKINIHGVEKEIEAKGNMKFINSDIQISSEFSININDFDIRIPKLVKDKISKEVSVDVFMKLNPK